MEKDELIKFLILSKRSTYPKDTPNKKENISKTFFFKKEDWKYLDTYYGNNSFSGIEIVFYKKIPIWSMSYFGMLTHRKEKNEIYSFLKEALSLVSEKNVYRGPEHFQKENFLYKNKNEGNLENFSGEEIIFKNKKQVYHLKYIGGFIN